jgi:hypothetical protein
MLIGCKTPNSLGGQVELTTRLDYVLFMNQRDKDKRFIGLWVPFAIKNKLIKKAELCGVALSKLVEKILKDYISKE